MLQKYMGNVTELYGKGVKYYMGSVLLGSDTRPYCIPKGSLLRCLVETIPGGVGVVGGKQVIIMQTQPQLSWSLG